MNRSHELTITLKMRVLWVVLVFGIFFCSPRKKNIQDKPDTLSLSSNSNVFKEVNPTTIERKTDTISVSFSGSPKILMTGTFHADEVWEGVEKENWYGLFPTEEGFIIRRTAILASRVVDGLLDDEEKDERTGWDIQTKTGEDAIVLIAGIGLTERKIPVADVPAQLYPGDTISFIFSGLRYQLFATGYLKTDTVHGTQHVGDYKLFISVTTGNKTIVDLLVSHLYFDDAMTSILWAGDIDGDSKLDLLIDRTDHYNVQAPALFLSRPARAGQVVVFVAEHRSVGC